MIKKLVTVAAASTFLMAAPLAFAQDATNPPAENSGTAPAAGNTTGSDASGTSGGATGTGTTDTTGSGTTGTDTSGTTGTDTSGATGTAGTASGGTTDAGEVAGTYLTEQSKDQISADDYIGTTVYNSNNESIGEINDLIIEKNGGVVAAVIGVGGFLGIGEKNVAVPMSNIMVSQADDGSDIKLTTSETSDTLKNAPEFKTLDDQATSTVNPAATGTTGPSSETAPAAPATGTSPSTGGTTNTNGTTGQ